MPRRKIVLPAEPVTKPEPGSLEETIYLGDCAAAYAKPLAQLRWYDRRGELQIAIQNRNKFTERIAELEQRIKDLEAQLAARPPAPAPTDRSAAVARMLKQLDAWGEEPSTPRISEEEKARREAEETAKKEQAEAERKAVADKRAAEAKAENERKAARIAELAEEKNKLIDRLQNPFRLKRVMQTRYYSDEVDERLAEIDKELAALAGTPAPKTQEPKEPSLDYDRQIAEREERQFTRRLRDAEEAARMANQPPVVSVGDWEL
jgi:hypothetical protein